ncbi:MAG: ASKHA domain-containing protein [Defluviitaleaceae bacterium]|nr:ASKHA domain-containing protein [Defluviitaleaceae bacterium]
MINIKIWKDGKPQAVSVVPSETLHRALTKHGMHIPAPCGGNGTCGKCAVSTSQGIKLSCQTTPTEGMEIYPAASEEALVILDTYESRRPFEYNRSGGYGVAIDIGTTTIAFEVIDLASGKRVATHSVTNSQRSLGADVVTRIKQATEGAQGQLHSYIIEDIRQGLAKVPQAPSVVAIAGNTTMLHLLQNLPCDTLGVFPFTPVEIGIKECLLSDILGVGDDTRLTILPGISTFVGADISAGLLCCYGPEPGLLIDLGTNGEMALFSKEKILVTSTAAGPAFEAGNISCGVASVPGAIAQVRYSPEKNVFIYETIDNQPPIGICGTGVVDIAAELVRHGLVDETGRLEDPYFDNGVEIAPGIIFTQKDMREIQLAKSALRSGVEILLDVAGYGYNDIGQVYLAGGFGHRMNMDSAFALGLIPAELTGKVVTVGNTSLGGAAHVLTSTEAIADILGLVAQAEEVNLSTHPRFNDLFMEHMMFEEA